MNLQRMKFAWARGARIQRWWADEDKRFPGGAWMSHEDVDALFGNPYATLRIHPEDEHLEYGPLSTALRGDNIHDWRGGTIESLTLVRLEAAETLMNEEIGIDYDLTRTEARMACLFFAEYLADQGL